MQCPSCQADVPPQFRFCGSCGAAVEGGDAPAAAPLAPPRPAPPPPALARGERRRVTILFADITGFTTFAEERDAEDVSDLVNVLFRDFTAIVERYGGYVDKYLGDAIMVLFGAPVAHENDPERAVRAALEMVAATRRADRATGEPFALRVGIHAGRVVAGAVGSGREADYTVTGDAANTAARLQAAAEPNMVLISDPVYRAVRHLVEADAMPPLTLKGKSQPVAAHAVVAIRREVAPRVHQTPFVGRDAELVALQTWAAEARAGRGQVIAAQGEAGIGKSRLGHEFRERLRDDGWTVLVGRAEPFADVPFGALCLITRDAIRLWAGEEAAPEQLPHLLAARLGSTHADLADALLELADLAPPQDPARPPLDAETRGRHRLLALALLFQTLARERPVGVTIEDVQWLDADTLALLGELADRCRHHAVLFLLTSRVAQPWAEVFGAGGAVQTLALPPLDAIACRRMLEHLAGDDPTAVTDPGLAASLVERSGGNPLFLEELAAARRERPDEMPETIEALLLTRLDQLPPGPRQAVRVAAVLGQRFPRRILRRVCARAAGPAGFEADLEELLARQVLLPLGAGRLVFQHALVREVAYDNALRQERRQLHHWAGEAIERLEPDRPRRRSRLAHHFSEAEAWPLAIPHLLAAGHDAFQQYAMREAERWLEKAAAAVERGAAEPTGVQQLALWDDLSEIRLQRGATSGAFDAVEHLDALANETASPRLHARVHFLRGSIHWAQAEYSAARGEFERGQLIVPADAEQDAARLLNALGIAITIEENPTPAATNLQAALAIWERLGDRIGQARASTNLGNLLALQDFDEAAQWYERALDLGRAIPDRLVITNNLSNLAMIRFWRGEYAAAEAAFAECLGYVEEMGLSHHTAAILQNLGRCLLSAGDLRGAAAAFERVIALGTQLGGLQSAYASMYLGRTYFAALHTERAVACWNASRALLALHADPDLAADLLLDEGRVALIAGDFETARRAFQQSHAQATERRYLDLTIVALGYQWIVAARADGVCPPAEWPPFEARRPLVAILHYQAARSYRACRLPDAAWDHAERAAAQLDTTGDAQVRRHVHHEAFLASAAQGHPDPVRASLHLAAAQDLTRRLADRLPPGVDPAVFLAHPLTRAMLDAVPPAA
ncbi:MAG: adenylate/guanylate cyclase domain-containing protein [Gemmatimonadota bacterium]